MRWSKYNPYYLEPEVKKEVYSRPVSELSAEEKQERELKVVRPIKAATNSVTSSVFDDPVIRYLKTTLLQNAQLFLMFCLVVIYFSFQ